MTDTDLQIIPDEIHREPLHGIKVVVWCLLSAASVIIPSFFSDAVKLQRYSGRIFEKFLLIYVMRMSFVSSSKVLELHTWPVTK